jgi:putative peptide zinc metalloprotease protein
MLNTRSSVSGATDSTEQPLSPSQQGQPGAVMEVPERPVLAPDVQLLGEMQGSGFQERQWLVQRGSRFIQLTELLYRVAEQVDGERTLEEIAARVTEATNWIVSADQARRLVQTKLMPLRLIATEQGQPQAAAAGENRARGPLGVNMRSKAIGPHIIDPLTTVLQVLYRPPVLIPVLLAIAAAHGWLYVVHGVSGSLYAALHTPGLLLAALAIMAVSGVVHEFGHASALRYGGGKARAIGAGFYLMYPVFYTDTTESYRLGRWARVRTDLGGFYFHLIFALGIMVIYVLSRQEFFLLVVVLIDLNIVNQCLPFVRFDGYWALADLTGLPDFFALMGPFVRSVWPWRRGKGSGGRLPHLKPWVKAVFALYIVVTIPALLVLLVLTIRDVPHMAAILWDAFLKQVAGFRHAEMARDYLGIAISLAMMFLLLLQAAGLAALFYTLGRGPAWRLMRALWTWSKPTLMRRLGGS